MGQAEKDYRLQKKQQQNNKQIKYTIFCVHQNRLCPFTINIHHHILKDLCLDMHWEETQIDGP